MKNKKMMVAKGIAKVVFSLAYVTTVINSAIFAYQPTLTDEVKNKIQSTR